MHFLYNLVYKTANLSPLCNSKFGFVLSLILQAEYARVPFHTSKFPYYTPDLPWLDSELNHGYLHL